MIAASLQQHLIVTFHSNFIIG